MKTPQKIENIRKELDTITEELVRLIAKRDELVIQISKEKKKGGLSILDPEREKNEIERAEKIALREDVDPELVREILSLLIKHSRELQK